MIRSYPSRKSTEFGHDGVVARNILKSRNVQEFASETLRLVGEQAAGNSRPNADRLPSSYSA
jgi:hypothetical protein